MSVNFRGPIRFCPHCGVNVEPREIAGRERPHCPSCSITFYADPKLAVAVLIRNGDRILLQRRTIDPGMGRWTFPSGYVEQGEQVEVAAAREVSEETGLDVRITDLVGLYSEAGNPVVLAVYAAEVTGGALEAGDETDAVNWFVPDRLPDLAFHHDQDIIDAWRTQQVSQEPR